MSAVRKRMAVIGTAALAIGVAVVVPQSTASGAASPMISVAAASGGYITSYSYSNGDKLQVYAPTQVTVTSGMTADPDGANAGTATGTNTDAGQITPKGTLTKATFSGSPVTATQELEAMGASATDAAPFAELDSPGQINTGTPVSQVTPKAKPMTSSVPIAKPLCVSKSGDGGRFHFYGCDSTYRVGTSGAVWYLEDKFLATGTMRDTAVINPDEVTGLKFGVLYGSGNQISSWSPASTAKMGSCRTNTVSLAYKGVGISSSTTECPETFGIYGIGPLHFSSKWDGQHSGPHNGSRETHGVDGVYNGATASPYPSIYWQYWWQ